MDTSSVSLTQANDNYRREEVRKAVLGIKNNMPALMPHFGLSARDKRKVLRAMGHEKPAQMATSDIPLVAIPKEVGPHVDRYARKLGAALYYKEKGKPIGPDFVMWTDWCFATDKRQMAIFLEIARMMPHKTVGMRRNLNFGDRFGYRYDKADDNDLFSAIAQFGQGLVLLCSSSTGSPRKNLTSMIGFLHPPCSAEFTVAGRRSA